jgi:hypothetical protein
MGWLRRSPCSCTTHAQKDEKGTARRSFLLAERRMGNDIHVGPLLPERALRRASLDGRNGTSMDAIPQEREIGEL